MSMKKSTKSKMKMKVCLWATVGVSLIAGNVSALGAEAIQEGTGSNAAGPYSIAIGYGTTASGGTSNIAIGREANATLPSNLNTMTAIAIGLKANSTGVGTVSLGSSASATVGGGTAVGLYSSSTAERGTALGERTVAAGVASSAIGSSAKVYNAASVAVGAGSIAGVAGENMTGAVAVGGNAQSLGNESIAIGRMADAQKAGAVVVGSRAKAGLTSVAVGNSANATGWNSAIIGNSSTSDQNYAVILGARSTITKGLSGAIGTSNTVNNANTYVMGNSIVTTQNNSVVLGNASADRAATAETTATVNGLTYSGFAGVGSVANGVLSVGAAGKERQVINVASGQISATSTDAINGSQLYATNNILGNVGKTTVTALGGNAAINADGMITMSDVGGTGTTTVHDAIGANKAAIDTNTAAIATNTAGIATNANAIAANTSAISALSGSLSGFEGRMNKVGAGAAALAALHPLDFDSDDKLTVAAGFGNYKNANSLAIGAFYRPNEDTMFSVAGSMGNGENMINAGVSFKFGSKNDIPSSKAELAKEVIELREKNQALSERLEEIENKMNALMAAVAQG